MHIPEYAKNMKEAKDPPIFLGLQGEPGYGKTWSALTFPNPVVLDFDAGLVAHGGKDIIVIPFYDYDFISSLNNGAYLPKFKNRLPNRRDALLWFLETEGFKLTSEQTLILDSWTTIQAAFDTQIEYEPKLTKDNKIDDYHPWQKKIDFSANLFSYLKALKCNVIITFHELKVRDPKTGQLVDKVAPLMQGQFVSRLKLYFPDFYRCIVEDDQVKDPVSGRQKSVKTHYFWQVRSDIQFQAKCSLALPENIWKVEPNYSIFKKYARTKSNTRTD